MAEQDRLAERFEEHRSRLRSVAYRILGSRSDADDAVQGAWLRFSRSDAGDIENPGAWLTTVVGRVSLNMLRSRRKRREDPMSAQVLEPVADHSEGTDPEHEAVLTDSVGQAMLVVLDTLSPAERVAFVLHDMFSVPFDEIAPIVDRTPEATRQLASRARRRVRGASPEKHADPATQREAVNAFLSASRHGDFGALLAVLDPEVVLRVHTGPEPLGTPLVVRGAEAVASRAQTFSRLDLTMHHALIAGVLGFVATRDGQLFSACSIAVRSGKIVAMDFIVGTERLSQLDLIILDE